MPLNKRTTLTVLAAIIGALITIVLVTASAWPVINKVETGKTAQYPDLMPQYFSADPQRVHEECLSAVVALDGWHVVEKSQREIHATADSLVGTADVYVTVTPQTEFVTRVTATSSTQWRGDFGQNARNIGALQREIDSRLGAVRFDPYAVEETEEP